MGSNAKPTESNVHQFLFRSPVISGTVPLEEGLTGRVSDSFRSFDASEFHADAVKPDR